MSDRPAAESGGFAARSAVGARLSALHEATDVRHWVGMLTVVALALRLHLLGQRIAHWDEGRVAYWSLRTLETGAWEYRPIIHGPFLQHVSRYVFAVADATDATMRLPVALVGGLLPMAALLFRTRLDDRETVALAAVFTFDPLFLYYSRFMRNDVLLAAFMLTALGFALHTLDSRDPRYLHGVGAALALAATTKENAVLYLLSWLGAGVMVGLWPLLVRRARGQAVQIRATLVTARKQAVEWLGQLWAWRRTLAIVAVEALVIVVFFYAPRAGTAGELGLWRALGDPALVPAVLEAATLESVGKVADTWLSEQTQAHGFGYWSLLLHYVVVLLAGSVVTVAFAVVGVVSGETRAQSAGSTRPIAAFGAWWGLSAIVGYPIAADLKAPWLTVHAVVGFALPAAVGLAAVVSSVQAPDTDRLSRVVLACLLVVSGAQIGVVAVGSSYTYPMPGTAIMAQSAQPGSDLRPTLARIDRTASDRQRPDVLYYGDLAVKQGDFENGVAVENVNDRPPAANNWYNRLPLPWYTERANATVMSAPGPNDLPENPPPVVVAYPEESDQIAPYLGGYRRYERAVFLLGETRTLRVLGWERRFGGQSLVFFVDEARIPNGTNEQ